MSSTPVMNIMTASNDAYLPYASLMLHSFLRNNGSVRTDIYIPYDRGGLSERSIEKLSDLARHFPGTSLHMIDVGEDFKKEIESRSGISIETYYRILALDMLPLDVDKILYLDADMIIRSSLKGLYDTVLPEGIPAAACEDIFGKINGFHDMNKIRMGIPSHYTYHNAGVMLFNVDDIRREGYVDKILQRIYKDNARYEYNDQDVMNELWYDRIKTVEWDRYNLPPAWYFLDMDSMKEGKLRFAGYDEIMSMDKDVFIDKYKDVTAGLYDGAFIIHYLADTKPWRKDRKEGAVYGIFDRAYEEEVSIFTGTFSLDSVPGKGN